MSVNIRQVAALASRGWHVFAVDSPESPQCTGIRTRDHDPATCTHRGKHPCVRWTSEASSDLRDVADQWVATGPRNVAIACGPSGLLVIDEDRLDALAAYARDHDVEVPDTYTVSTGKGRHYYYAAPAGITLGNQAGPLKAYGIDVRGAGGYVVGPGSLHASGALYDVERDVDPAPLPRWLLEALTPSTTSSSTGTRSAMLPDRIRGPRADGPGERHDRLVRYASSLRGRNVDVDEAEVLFRAAWERCEQPPTCTTPMPWEEARDGILRDVYTRYPAGPSEERVDVRELLGIPERDHDAVENGEGDVVDVFDREVEYEAQKLRIRQAARDVIDRERAQVITLPPLARLDHFLALPDPDVAYRIERVWPSGGRVVFAAQFKAGKTTAVANTLRSLADGDPLFETFSTAPAGRVILIDNELDENMLRRWLRDQGIRNEGAVELVSLRGKLSAFNIIDPAVRAQWAAHLGPADVLVFDCLRPALDALGLDENRDAGRFLEALDELLVQAGIPEAIVVHHMGHNGERSRGDSRILDWPDALWKLLKDARDDGSEARYFTAYGRDVDVPECLLEFDVVTRHLSVAGGSRTDQRVEAALSDVVEVMVGREPLSGRAVEELLKGTDHPRTTIRAALKRGVRDGLIATSEGPRRATMHVLTPSSAPVRRSAPPVRQTTEIECASAPIGMAHSLTHSTTETTTPSTAHTTPLSTPTTKENTP